MLESDDSDRPGHALERSSNPPEQRSADRGLTVQPDVEEPNGTKRDPKYPTEPVERQKHSFFNPHTLEREIGLHLASATPISPTVFSRA